MANEFLMQIPSLQELQRYNVNRPDALEGLKQSLYDFQTYPAAGTTQLNFFQVPVGQSGKTLADTNMEVAGSLPTPKHFLVLNVQVFFFPAGNPSAVGAPSASTFVNDTWAVAKAGWLDFFIGSKSYLTEAPIVRFPPRNGLIVSSSQADSTTAAANQHTRIAYANFGGAPYAMKPPILLVPTQNFRVSLNFPSAVAISGDARIGVVLEGLLYRLSQ